MKGSIVLAICLMLAVPPPSARGQGSAYDPDSKQRSQPREGFVDFALKQLNPRNTDYGCQLEEVRKIAVDQTVKRIDSWAVLVALGFLVVSFLLLLHQHRERNRRTAIAAQFLAQYHNAWVDARARAADAMRRYYQLVDTSHKAGEDVYKLQSTEAEAAQARPVRADVGRSVKTQSPSVAAAGSDIKAGEPAAFRSDGTCQNRETEAGLFAQISTLQQQLNASHEREKNLQKELTKAQRRPPALQSRDAGLPR
jgi:hypothetical protein